MSSVKFVHVLKRIEALERDIGEIHSLQGELDDSRSYSTPIKISLEQQVNNLLNEKTKLMEVRIDNPPDFFTLAGKSEATKAMDARVPVQFDLLEKDYFQHLDNKRNNISEAEPKVQQKSLAPPAAEPARKPESIPSLAEKSIVSKEEQISSKTGLTKKRSDLLKDLPPLEY